MRRMSFSLTKEQVKDKSKTVTRRNGWRNLKVDDQIQPIEKGMGLKKGEKQVLIGGPIRITKVNFEPLAAITQADVVREGFPNMTTKQFVDMYMKANRCLPTHEVTRIEYEYV